MRLRPRMDRERDLSILQDKKGQEMGLNSRDFKVGEKVFIYGFPGKVVRVLERAVDIGVGGVIDRFSEFDKIEKDDERAMHDRRDG